MVSSVFQRKTRMRIPNSSLLQYSCKRKFKIFEDKTTLGQETERIYLQISELFIQYEAKFYCVITDP